MLLKIYNYFLLKIIKLIYLKRYFFRLLSKLSLAKIKGKYEDIHPVFIWGEGVVEFGKNISFGWLQSNFYFGSYSFLNPRDKSSYIKFGDNVTLNNCSNIIAEKGNIIIGNNVLIGSCVSILNSDFHHINYKERNKGNHAIKDILINDNVWIGSNCIILKGVEIGKNSVIGSGSVVTRSIPENKVAAGNPAKIIKSIEE